MWTTPRTWTTGEVVTAAMLNEQLRDNSTFLADHKGCKVYLSAAQTIPSNAGDAFTIVTFDTERYDTDGLHSTSSNPGRITVPGSLVGYWMFGGEVEFAASGAGSRRDAVLQKNGATAISRSRPIGTPQAVVVRIPASTTTEHMAANDYVQLGANQDSGGGLDAQSGVDATHVWAAYIGQ